MIFPNHWKENAYVMIALTVQIHITKPFSKESIRLLSFMHTKTLSKTIVTTLSPFSPFIMIRLHYIIQSILVQSNINFSSSLMNQGIYFGQMVIGPAGSGKSTYCKVMQEMAQTLQRNIIIFNLDPAAEYNTYRCDVDIKELVTLEEVMEEMELGPNGGLLFCMEYFLQNQSWFQEKLNQFVGQDDYVIFDCPGQIELYNDRDFFREIARNLQNYGFSLISMYMMDVNFIQDENKFLSGFLQSLSIQIALELPSITVLTKCDLVSDKQKIEKYLSYFTVDEYGNHDIDNGTFYAQIKKIINNNDIVSLKPLNLKQQDSIRELLLQADQTIQYGQNLQPNDKQYQRAEQMMNQNRSDMASSNQL